MNQKKFYVALVFILLLNLFLKFNGIGESSIWLDEAYSINEAKYSAKEIITHSSQSDNPPLYYLLLHGWSNIFGFSEAGMRSLSALCSVLAACIIFVFVSREFSFETGLISSLLFSLSNQNIYYAQEVRTYALISFLTALSLGFYFVLYRKNKKSAFIGLTISNILLVYSHYLSVCIPLLQVVLSLIYAKRNLAFAKRNLLSAFLVFIVFIPWAQIPFSNRPKPGTFWLDRPNFANLKGIFIEIANSKLCLVTGGLIIIACYVLRFRKNKSLKDVFTFMDISLMTFYIAPVIILFFVSNLTPVFLLRYLLFISIPYYILVGYCLTEIADKSFIRYGITGILILFSLRSIELHPQKQEDWKHALEYVQSIRKQKQPIILSATYTVGAFSYYYDKEIFLLNDSIRENKLIDEKVYLKGKTSFEVMKTIVNNQPVIGVFSHEIDQDPENTNVNNLAKIFKISESKQFGKVKVISYSEPIAP